MLVENLLDGISFIMWFDLDLGLELDSESGVIFNDLGIVVNNIVVLLLLFICEGK